MQKKIKTDSTIKTDVLIIGAGPSGAVSASILKKQGFHVTVIEKTKFPRFVIGESLLPLCMDLLDEANLLEAVEKKSFQKKFGAIFTKGDKSSDFDFSEQFSKSWSWTWQVQRSEFDKALIDEVEKKGAIVLYETTVEDVEFINDKVLTSVSSRQGTDIFESKYIIDSSGYGRVLPKLLDLEKSSTLPHRSAFFTQIKDVNRPEGKDSNRIQVIVVNDAVWVWMIPLNHGITSVGFVGDLDLLEGALKNEQEFRKLIDSNEILKERFGGLDYVFEPKKIIGYSSAVKQFYGNKYVLTGNSTEFLDPIFSSGVTFALASGVLAAKLIVKELKNEKVDWESEYVDVIQSGVAVFRSYIDAWYDGDLQTVFFTEGISQDIKKMICSVLSGYVWDNSNYYVKKHKKAIKTLAKVIELKQNI